MHIADSDYLQTLLGTRITLLAFQVSGGISPSGTAFFGAHSLYIPRSDFSAGRPYTGDFLEISTEWHQTTLGDDYHLLTIKAIEQPSFREESALIPYPDLGSFAAYPGFRADYFTEAVTRIEVFETEVRNETLGSTEVEYTVYDSHIRFVGGERAFVLTTEHGAILGEIEIYAGAIKNFPETPGLIATRLRQIFEW